MIKDDCILLQEGKEKENLEKVVRIIDNTHTNIIQKTGGKQGYHSIDNLRATLGKLYRYQTLEDVITQLMFGIIQGHPFTDGNKRTALAAGTVMLEKNNFFYDSKDMNFYQTEMEEVVVWIAEKEISKKDLCLMIQYFKLRFFYNYLLRNYKELSGKIESSIRENENRLIQNDFSETDSQILDQLKRFIERLKLSADKEKSKSENRIKYSGTSVNVHEKLLSILNKEYPEFFTKLTILYSRIAEIVLEIGKCPSSRSKSQDNDSAIHSKCICRKQFDI